MAMLAEPRRKQRIGPNPRGKFFIEEELNAGRTMLQKMGWKNGDGLGKEKQGMAEPIRPKIQMTPKGLGFDIKSDPWVQHCQEFTDVLKQLNEIKGTDADSQEQDIKPEKQELESKSKASRSRIHYHKFVKGKDLSRASSTDLKSIFGNSTEAFHAALVIKDEPKSGEVSTENPDVSFSQINCGSMADYFAKKMSQKRGHNGKHEEEVGFEKKSIIKQDVSSELASTDLEASDSDVKNMDNLFIRKLKKKKKIVAQQEKSSEIASTDVDGSDANLVNCLDSERSKKKSKKRKKNLIEQQQTSAEIPAPELEIVAVDDSDKVVKKRKKRKNEAGTKNVELADEVNTDDMDDNTQRSSRRRAELMAEEAVIVQADDSNKVVKKRKKRKNESGEKNVELTDEVNTDDMDDNTKRRSRQLPELQVEEAKASPPSDNAEPPQPQEETLEQRLKREMIQLKSKRRKDCTPEEMMRMCKRFPGANLHKIKGYAYY